MIAHREKYADFYKVVYAEISQEHRPLWNGGPAMFKAYDRPPGQYLEPAMADVSLQICTRGCGGDARLDLNAGAFRASERRGLFVVTPAGESCRYIIRDPLDILIIPFDQSSIAEITDGRGSTERLSSHGWQDDTVLQLAETLWASVKHGDDQLFAEYVRMAVLARLCRPPAHSPSFATASLHRRHVRRVIEMFESNLARNFTLATLAHEVGLSPFHFARAFKASTGMPPHRYQITLRIERAKDLLANSELSMSDISAAVGYEDQGQLARIFRKEVGLTPSQYRRELRA